MESEEKQRNYERAEGLLKEQHFGVAVLSGTITMILGSGLYAASALAVGGPSVSVMVVGIGAAIGLTMQYLGRGITARFVVAASFIAMIGFLVAKLFTIALYTVKSEHISPLDLLSTERVRAMWDWVLSGLHLLDLIFWIAAIGAAAFFSRRRLSHEEGLAMYTYERK